VAPECPSIQIAIAFPTNVKRGNERKKVEMRFAHLKTHHGFERVRLRGRWLPIHSLL
jgi:hypothetical protein